MVPPPPPAWVTVTVGRDPARVVALPPEGAVVGRAADCLLRCSIDALSRRHARIFAAGDRWFVEDLGSSSGTYVNGSHVCAAELREGDLIRCGQVQLVFSRGPARASVAE